MFALQKLQNRYGPWKFSMLLFRNTEKYQFSYIPTHTARGNPVSCRSRERKQNEHGFPLQITSPSLFWTQVRSSSIYCTACVMIVHILSCRIWYGIRTPLPSRCLWHTSAVSLLLWDVPPRLSLRQAWRAARAWHCLPVTRCQIFI